MWEEHSLEGSQRYTRGMVGTFDMIHCDKDYTINSTAFHQPQVSCGLLQPMEQSEGVKTSQAFLPDPGLHVP